MRLAKRQQIHIQLVQQAALFIAAHHAFNPEETGQAVPTCDGLDLVQAGARVNHQMPSGQLDGLLAIGVGHAQLAAVIVVWVIQKQGAGDVGAHALATIALGTGLVAHRAVNMLAVRVAGTAVAVKPGREDALGQRCREEGGLLLQPLQHHLADGACRHTVVRQLLIVFYLARLLARARFAVLPDDAVQKLADFSKLLGGQYIFNGQQHGSNRDRTP